MQILCKSCLFEVSEYCNMVQFRKIVFRLFRPGALRCSKRRAEEDPPQDEERVQKKCKEATRDELADSAQGRGAAPLPVKQRLPSRPSARAGQLAMGAHHANEQDPGCSDER